MDEAPGEPRRKGQVVWVETDTGDYVNVSALASKVLATGGGGSWSLQLKTTEGSGVTTYNLAGTWASQADAQDAARKLLDGIDPSTY